MPKTVGILHSGSQDAHGPHIDALLGAISDAGYVDGDNVTILAPLFSDDDPTKLAANAKTLAVTSPVDVIIAAGGSTSALAAKLQTTTIPIVFTTVTDPVLSGLVASLDTPGGNLTGTAGLTSELDPKRLELLKEFSTLPAGSKIGVLANNSRLKFIRQMAELTNAANALSLTLNVQNATKSSQIDNAFDAFALDANIKAILVTADPLFNNRRKKVIKRVKDRTLKVPAIYQWREFPEAGGLMSYGPSIISAYQSAGTYAAQILDGTNPKDLPVLLPDAYELVINIKTASRMGFKVPISMLTRAVLLQRKRK